MRVNMKRARECVKAMIEFQGNNVYARWDGNERYVVYSYGDHWPLYVYEKLSGKWYRNTEKRSVTTSKHSTMLHPGAPCDDIDKTEDMTSLAAGGVIQMIEAREDRKRMRAVHETFVQNVRRNLPNFPIQTP